MERLSVARKSPKEQTKAKSKKKPIKIVYISNPMRVRTSESEFRAVVQELTGQDSDVADNMAKYPTAEAVAEAEIEKPKQSMQACLEKKSAESPFEIFQEDFAPYPLILDNFSGLVLPSSPFYQDGTTPWSFDG